MKVGYTKAYRKELNSDIWKMPPLYQRIFFYLRQEACWQPEIFPTRKGYGIALNPGQLITSFSTIAEGVSWYEYGVKKVPNKKIIKDILGWLESNSMVTVLSNRHGTLIMLTNWDAYNCIEDEKVTQNNQTMVTPKKRSADTLKEEKREEFLSDSIEFRLASYLFKFILRRNSNHKKPNLQNWAEHINLMIRVDKRDPKDIKQIIKWCQEDTPDKQPEGQWKGWANNILSTKKLREKYDKLFVKMQESQCKQLPVITKQALQPKTYAQAKDFEQRMLAKSLLKELRNEKID